MTYCLAISVENGAIFASDSRTNAGVDYVTTYSKMHVFEPTEDRLFVLLSAGNLATTQEVLNRIEVDLNRADASVNLRTVNYLFEAAEYIGRISIQVQESYMNALARSNISGESSFIIGGQIQGQPHGIYMIYPQGNYISASPETPYLQIGETKYGKPILDRVIKNDTTLDDAARCALVSLDSTIRSNVTVGPPLELAIYHKDTLDLSHYMSLNQDDEMLTSIRETWDLGLKNAFLKLPRFDWEQVIDKDRMP